MATAVEITLPKQQVPRFPAKCVCCEQAANDRIRLHHNGQSPLAVVLVPILWACGWSTIEAPICRSCKPKFLWQRWGRGALMWAATGTAVFCIAPHVADLPPIVRKLVGIALVVAAISPLALLEVLCPRRFDTTAHRKTVDYAFASPTYAAEFRELNSLTNRSNPTLRDPETCRHEEPLAPTMMATTSAECCKSRCFRKFVSGRLTNSYSFARLLPI
ncbi:MAG: hypothetical protein QM775_27465 [Pirellulales bacterium]